MPMDISKIFKAIRMTLANNDDNNELLNEELFGKSKTRKGDLKKNAKSQEDKLASSVAKDLRSIVSYLKIYF